MSGTPFNCAEDITAYYEIEDCGEIDKLQLLFSEKENRVLPLQSIFEKVTSCSQILFDNYLGMYTVQHGKMIQTHIT